MIIFKFHCYLDYTKPKDRYAYGKGDYDAMRNELSDTNWQEEYVTSASNKNIAELWGTLKSTLKQLRDKFVPIAKLSANSSWKKLGGFPIDKTFKMPCVENMLHIGIGCVKKKRGNADLSRLEYTEARNKVTKLIRKAKRIFEGDVAEKALNNPKGFLVSRKQRVKIKSWRRTITGERG